MGGTRDCRYKKTEEKILTVFFNKPRCKMCKLARKIGIARSTFYTHHHSVHEIIPDYEREILTEYGTMIKKKLKKKNVGIKILYFDTLIFILKNRQAFEMFLKFEDREVIIKMILRLKPKIKEPEKVWRICVSELAEIIFEWGERGFSEREIEKMIGDMLYLTLSARKRLAPLV